LLPSAGDSVSQHADGRKRRAGSEPPPRLAPSIRSGLVSGDGIVAAGRKKVFSRVAETRALAAQANRARAARSRLIPEISGGGSTTSGGSPPVRLTRALIVVSFFYINLPSFKVKYVLLEKLEFFYWDMVRTNFIFLIYIITN
jgi:hypothetical protein